MEKRLRKKRECIHNAFFISCGEKNKRRKDTLHNILVKCSKPNPNIWFQWFAQPNENIGATIFLYIIKVLCASCWTEVYSGNGMHVVLDNKRTKKRATGNEDKEKEKRKRRKFGVKRK